MQKINLIKEISFKKKDISSKILVKKNIILSHIGKNKVIIASGIKITLTIGTIKTLIIILKTLTS